MRPRPGPLFSRQQRHLVAARARPFPCLAPRAGGSTPTSFWLWDLGESLQLSETQFVIRKVGK